jgi:N-acetylmuramoyl-L-alanine amidase
MALKVFIGVGHGGSDPGAVANGFKEKDVNLVIATACAEELERHGVSVLMSRKKDDNESLTEKINECNAFNPKLALDIHNNAGGGDGGEVYHHYKGGTGKTLALNILKEMFVAGQNAHSITPNKYETGAKIKKNSSGKDAFVFIRNTVAPAVIVECAFLDNKKDLQIIDTAAEQKAMGIAIAKGVLKTLGIVYKAVEKPVEKPVGKPASGKLYRVQVGAYGEKKNADAMLAKLKKAGFDGIVVEG